MEVGGKGKIIADCELRIANLEARRQKKLIALRKGVEIVEILWLLGGVLGPVG